GAQGPTAAGMQGAVVSSWLPTSKETLTRPYTVKSNGLCGGGGCLTSDGTAGPVGAGFSGGFAASAGFCDCACARLETARGQSRQSAITPNAVGWVPPVSRQ